MSAKVDDNGTNYSFPYMREITTKTKLEKFALWVWNPSEKQFFGRTGKSWAQLLLFYTIFYAALASLFAISMKGLLSTINSEHPKWQLDSSTIGTNPGVGFRPISNITEEGSLIWYNSKNEKQIQKWVNLLNDFLTPYFLKAGSNREICDYDKFPGPGKVCEVDVKSWDPCTANKSYSYPSSSPCFFIKVNRIYGWVPQVYDDPSNLPGDMPDDLKNHIANLEPKKRKQVWISCEGEDPVDKELIQPGDIEYIPERGLPLFYYPYLNAKGYLSPLVAIRLKRPKLNRIINIECRAWAKNIQYVGGQRDRQGSVHFEVMID